tara:strand:- start:225 stop:623 length:399 start_codon:yes stop_codon:yes gene_type:complete
MIEKPDYIQDLKSMTTEEIHAFIRNHLNKDGRKIRFKMSGYDDNVDNEILKGSCTIHNQKILNKFAYLGIYDYTNFLVLDFYKGWPTLALMYWCSDELFYDEHTMGGYKTTELIHKIFELTILSDKTKRTRQ